VAEVKLVEKCKCGNEVTLTASQVEKAKRKSKDGKVRVICDKCFFRILKKVLEKNLRPGEDIK
jgi:hypothetical protein